MKSKHVIVWHEIDKQILIKDWLEKHNREKHVIDFYQNSAGSAFVITNEPFYVLFCLTFSNIQNLKIVTWDE